MRIALALLLMCGCNQVFGLEPGSGDDVADGGGDGPPPDGLPDDLDSDGVRDSVDSCPTVYNPRQADEDGDAEINGGDACDPCPHRASNPPGSPHLDSDGDGLGDDCDPDDTVWHCLRWFDGFSDAPDATVLARYTSRGGTWTVDVGTVVQSDPLAEHAELVIDDLVVVSGFVATQGRMDELPTLGPTGQAPYRNAAGVIFASGVPACFASVSRDITNGVPGTANVTLSSRTNNEIINATTTMGIVPVSMTQGEHFGVTFDALTLPDSPTATAALFERSVSQSVGAVIMCAPGAGGMRTAFAAIRFQYLLVLEQGTPGTPCPARLPVSGPVQ